MFSRSLLRIKLSMTRSDQLTFLPFNLFYDFSQTLKRLFQESFLNYVFDILLLIPDNFISHACTQCVSRMFTTSVVLLSVQWLHLEQLLFHPAIATLQLPAAVLPPWPSQSG